jgi:hypothetical protein
MKTLQKFLTDNPGYLKCSAKTVADRLKLSLTTVERFKKTEMFKTMNHNYRNKN